MDIHIKKIKLNQNINFSFTIIFPNQFVLLQLRMLVQENHTFRGKRIIF